MQMALVSLCTFTMLSETIAAPIYPTARPEKMEKESKAVSGSVDLTSTSAAVSRPSSRPDKLYKSVILSELETMAGDVSAPKIFSTSQGTVLPVKRPASISHKAKKKSTINQASALSHKDKKYYGRIFEYQKAGRWAEADELINKIDNPKLVGHVLYQRYMHPTKYRSSFNELVARLDFYNDLPNANEIYRLANARMPAGFSGHVAKPKKAKRMRGSLEHQITDRSSKARNAQKSRAVSALKRKVSRHLSKGQPSAALTLVNSSDSTKLMSSSEADQLLARIAASYLYEGRRDKAEQYAKAAWNRSQANVPLAGWVAGLTAWMRDDYISAATYFSHTSDSQYANGWLKSASAYWAARAYKQLRNSTNHQKWLLKAAQHPRTFYGLIATRALGKNALNKFNWDAPKFNEQHAQILHKISATNRAMALVESGQHHLAELEFRQVYPGANAQLQEAMLAYALNNGLASFALRFGNTYKAQDGKLYDSALYPVGGWKPKNGYQMDKALIHAFIRQESEFNPTAENPSGATGLMQLMPRTASYVAGDKNYGGKLGRYLLKDPKENLEIGQKYIQQLINQPAISRDLFSLAMAYNAGPGNLRKWKNRYADIKDPLLFVELIPLSETRSFVERVMRNLWIYRQRMNQPTPSLDNVASGNWARYVQLDTDLPFDIALSE